MWSLSKYNFFFFFFYRQRDELKEKIHRGENAAEIRSFFKSASLIWSNINLRYLNHVSVPISWPNLCWLRVGAMRVELFVSMWVTLIQSDSLWLSHTLIHIRSHARIMLAPPGYQNRLSSLLAVCLSPYRIIVTPDWLIVLANLTSGAFFKRWWRSQCGARFQLQVSRFTYGRAVWAKPES